MPFFFSFLSVTYSLSFIHSLSLPHFFCSCPLIHSPSLSASTSCFDLSSCHPFLYLYQISIPFSSGPRLPSPALVLSLCWWFWGFAVKCVGGEKKSFLCKKKKKITYHFSVLVLSLSRWICSQQCHRVSLEMTFYSVSRSQWGHAAGTTLWLSLYPHYSFLLKSSPDLGAEGKEQSVDFCHLSQPPKSCPVHDRQSNYEKLACIPKPQEKNTYRQKPSYHLDMLNHRESLDDRWASLQKFPLCTRLN